MAPLRLAACAVVALLVCLSAACSSEPLAPASPDLTIDDIGYAINIPDPIVARQLITQYPNGVQTPPIDAQRVWNYTAEYGGTPNVYWGPLAPPVGLYTNTGIVVAPLAIASKPAWKSSEWPDMYGQSAPNTIYRWLGRFVYTRAGLR